MTNETVQQVPPRRPDRRQAVGCWIPLLIVVLILAVAVYKGIRIWPHASALVTRARTLRALASADPASLLQPQRLTWVRDQVDATRNDLQAIRSEIGFLLPLVERLDWIPRFGGDIAATPALMDLGIELCDAGWWGLLGAGPVWDALYSPNLPAGQSALEAVLPALIAAQPRFSQAAQAVARARPALNRLQQHELSPRVAGYVARAAAYWPVLEGTVLLAQDLPALLGQSRPMSYLLLAQNNQELRPTGGFISGVGLIQLSAGKIVSTTFQDSYAVDARCDIAAFPPAPPPLRQYMWAPMLVFRDANWSPDFPASAATASSIYRLCTGVNVDGVVAMDLEAVSLLLGALGPLQPEGYSEVVTKDTLLKYVNEYWTNPLRSVDITDEQQGQWWLHRKDFMGDLLQAALKRVTVAPKSLELAPLGMAVLKALQSRHLLVTLKDPQMEGGLSTAGWNGALSSVLGDYLMVVDANIGYRKVNPLVEQSVEYGIEFGAHQDAAEAQVAQRSRATLAVRYTNRSRGSAECVAGSSYEHSYVEMMEGCYWDYLRVYVPLGSRLLSMQGADAAAQTSTEAGKTVFSTLLVVAPGQTRDLVLQYELPASLRTAIGSGRDLYGLLVQKQAGTVAVPYRVTASGPGWQFSPTRSTPVDGYDEQVITFGLATDTQLTWVDASGWSKRATAPILVFAGVGLLLIGLGLWVGARDRVAPEA